MPRKTKEETELTRRRILEAARRTFHERGVSATSLEHIAQAAGVTRGAIYWHFQNKEDLFKAMHEDVLRPWIDQVDRALVDDLAVGPLARLQSFLMQVVHAWTSQEPVREVLEIMEFKCEYVGPMSGDLESHRAHYLELVAKLEAVHREAAERGELRAGLTPRIAALETASFLWGLARLVIMHTQGECEMSELRALIEGHVGNRRTLR